MIGIVDSLKDGRDELLVLIDRFKKLRNTKELSEWEEYDQTKKELFDQELELILVDLRDVTKRFEAARRAIGLTNQLPKDDPNRKKYRSVAFGHMNRFRAAIRRLEKAISELERKYNYVE